MAGDGGLPPAAVAAGKEPCPLPKQNLLFHFICYEILWLAMTIGSHKPLRLELEKKRKEKTTLTR